jgi:RNA polymerase sigma-70 factor (ECF subfamily)
MDNHINDILIGCSHNDRRSQKELYELFSKPVFSTCYRYESRLPVIQELVNESFIRVFKNIRKFVDNQYTDTYVPFSLQAWIRQIVVLTCIEYYRKGLMNYEVPIVQAETNNNIKRYYKHANNLP